MIDRIAIVATCTCTCTCHVHVDVHDEELADYRVGGLHITGAPPLDRALVAEAERYESVVGTRLLGFDGAQVLANHGGDLVLLRAPGNMTTLATDLDVAWAGFGPSGVVYTADRDGDEQTRLYRDGRVVRDKRVVDPVADDHEIVWSERDGDVTAIRTTHGEVLRDTGTWTMLQLAGDQVLARRDKALYRIDLASRRASALTPATGGALGPDGELYAIGSAGDRMHLFRGGVDLTPDLGGDVTEVASDGTLVAYVSDGELLHVYPHVATGAPTGGVISDLHVARGIVAFTFSDARHPRDVYTYDPREARAQAWTRADLGGLAVVEPARERTTSFDGTSIEMLVYRPSRRAPVVIELHGGPEDRFSPRWSPFAQLLAARGYAVVQPNVRGSSGAGVAFAALDDGRRREDAVRDVGAVLDWIARRPELDAHAVTVLGTSYGGYLALASLLAYPDRLRAGVDISGIADFVSFLEHTARYRADERRAEYGDERDPATRAFLTKISPLPRAAAIRAPLVVAHGRRDPRVPAGDADRLVAAVRAAGGRAWYVSADDEGHEFSRTANRSVLQALVMQLLAATDLHRSAH
jgi:dienelactone hydrolase